MDTLKYTIVGCFFVEFRVLDRFNDLPCCQIGRNPVSVQVTADLTLLRAAKTFPRAIPIIIGLLVAGTAKYSKKFGVFRTSETTVQRYVL